MGTFGRLLLADHGQAGERPLTWLGAKAVREPLCSQAWSYSHAVMRAKGEGAMTPRKWSGIGYLSSGNRQQGVHDRQHFADVHVGQVTFLR